MTLDTDQPETHRSSKSYDGSHVPEPYKLSCTLMVPVTIGNKKQTKINLPSLASLARLVNCQIDAVVYNSSPRTYN